MKYRVCILAAILLFGQTACAEEKDTPDNDVEQSSDSEPPHSRGEIAYDVGMGIASSAAGGVSFAHGNIPGGIVGVAAGAKCFKDAADKYHENREHERERERERERDREPDHDRDSWDRDY